MVVAFIIGMIILIVSIIMCYILEKKEITGHTHKTFVKLSMRNRWLYGKDGSNGSNAIKAEKPH